MVNASNDFIPVFNVQNAPYSAPINGTDATTKIQNALNDAGAAANGVEGTATVFFPAGQYQVSQLTIPSGVTLQGVHSSAYGIPTAQGNMDQPGWPVSMLQQKGSSNKDMIVCAAGANYQRFYDLGFDGNKGSNTSGRGLVISDDASGSLEAQQIIQRCFFFNFHDSGIYIGQHRRAVKVLDCVSNYSAVGDGITLSSSDATIKGCIFGSNAARAGICLGTTTSTEWASFGNNVASGLIHVEDNDIYGNLVGISVASGSWGSMILNNGIDRNIREGITVYDGYDTSILGNCLHTNSNLLANDGVYPHIALGSGSSSVNRAVLEGNIFGPRDSGYAGYPNYGVYVYGTAYSSIVGSIGVLDTSANPSVHKSQGLIYATTGVYANTVGKFDGVWRAPENGLVSWPFDIVAATGTASMGTAGTLYVVRMHVPTACLATNVTVNVAGAGTTLQNCFAGIWQQGSNTQMGITADQSTVWNSTGFKTMAIAGGAVTLAAGDYYVGFYWNTSGGGSAPVLSCGLNSAAVNVGSSTAGRWGSANTGLGATPPATLGSVTATNASFWAGIS